jgi:hypothetical protein
VLDTVAGQETADIALLVSRMGLDLVDHRHYAGLVDNPLEMFHQEIRDPDASHQSVLPRLDQRLPGVDVGVPGRSRPMDEEHVQIVEAEVIERLANAGKGAVVTHRLRPQLACDEQFAAIDIGLPKRNSYAPFVIISLSRVDRAIPSPDRLADSRADFIVRNLPDAETDLGY